METVEKKKVPMIMDCKQVIELFFNNTISLSMLSDMVRQGTIPYRRIGNKRGRVLFNRDKLVEWFNEEEYEYSNGVRKID